MNIELSEEVNKEMFLLNCNDGQIISIHVARESKSGETVETENGKRYRTNCKRHKVFWNFNLAMIGRMQLLGKTDHDEYRYRLKEAGISRTAFA